MKIEVEIEGPDGELKWVPATVGSVHLDSLFSAEIQGDEDDKWVDNYVKTARKRLTVSRTAFKDALKAANIPLFESQGTLMGWADFRGMLRESSWEAENELWEELYKECGWMIKRGREYATSEPGWFCVMLTSQNFHDDDSMKAPFEELSKRLVAWKQAKEAGKN